jgi:integrase
LVVLREKPVPIEIRHRTYFAYLDVPKDVRKGLGRRIYRHTLQTDSRSVADRRAALLIAQWKAEIARAREEPNHNDAKFWRDALRRSKTPEERFIIESDLETHVLMQGLDNTDPEAQRFYGEAFGTLVPTLEYLEEWISSIQVKDKTARMRRATIGRLVNKFPVLNDVSRKEVRRWVTELMAELKPATVQRMMTDCRTYWAYLATIEAVPEESAPFDRLGLKVKSTPRIPWSPKDLVALHCAAEVKNQVLADLIKLAMYSGARLGELVNLRVADVEEDHYRITSSKTEAGVRVVPIHREVQQTMARLIEESKDGYILSGITGRHRVDTMSKAFQRLRKKLGYTDKRLVFHSIRNTMITLLERAGVPEGTVQDLIGHERSTLAGSTYSGKSTIEMRNESLDKLAY